MDPRSRLNWGQRHELGTACLGVFMLLLVGGLVGAALFSPVMTVCLIPAFALCFVSMWLVRCPRCDAYSRDWLSARYCHACGVRLTGKLSVDSPKE